MSMPRPPLADSYEGLLSRARMSYRMGDVARGISLYRRLVEKLDRLSDRILDRRPELRDLHREARLEMADLLRLEGRYAEALEVKQVLLDTHPDEAALWRHDLAILRVAKGDVDGGLAELRVLAEEDPADPAGWIALARESRIEGRFAESQIALDRVLEASGRAIPDDLAQVHFQRFLLYKEMGHLDDAIGAWEEAVALKPEMRDTVREVHTGLVDAGRYSEAQRYVDRDENSLQAGLQRGIVAQLTGNPDKARQEWQAVADLDPEDFESGHDCWVEAVLRLGDPQPALERLEALLAQHGTPRLLVLAGIAWVVRGDEELASALLQQAINLLRRGRPPKQKLDSADWRLLDSLVSDDESKRTLKPYFAVVETLWT